MILLTRAHILTMDDSFREYPSGYVLVDGGRIAALGPMPEAPGGAGTVIDCGGGLLLPGLINLHAHASMVPFRSMGDDCPDRLRRFLFPLENAAMTPRLVYRAARYAMLEMLMSGTTTFVDMYYFEEEVARACGETGLRGYLGQSVLSQKTPDAQGDASGLARAERFLRAFRGHPMVHPILAPHGTTTVSAEALRACMDLAERYDTLLTLHASEMDYEMEQFRRQGTTPIAFLDHLGLVRPRLIAAHAIHLTEEDILTLSRRGASVAHCIGSNAKAGKGVAPVRDLAAAGVPFGLGTDGPSSGNTLSLFDQMRLFPIAQKTRYHDRSLFPAREVVYAATRGGARCLHAEDTLGQIAPGFAADLVLVGTRSPAMFPVFNPYSALVYAAGAGDVELVMVAGRILVRDRRPVEIDPEAERSALLDEMGPFLAAARAYPDML